MTPFFRRSDAMRRPHSPFPAFSRRALSLAEQVSFGLSVTAFFWAVLPFLFLPDSWTKIGCAALGITRLQGLQVALVVFLSTLAFAHELRTWGDQRNLRD